jgi:hypothetical protein
VRGRTRHGGVLLKGGAPAAAGFAWLTVGRALHEEQGLWVDDSLRCMLTQLAWPPAAMHQAALPLATRQA